MAELDKQIKTLADSNEVAQRLQQLRGVGPLVATALIATVGTGEQYCKGKQMAAALGLTPRQCSSGDKQRLLGISKRGDVYLRTMLIHGARAVVSQAKHRDDRLSGECQASCRQKLMHRCHPVSWSERRQYHFRHRFPVPGLAAPSFRVSGTRHLVCLITLP